MQQQLMRERELRRKYISFSGGLENALPTYFRHLLDMDLGIIVAITGSPDWKSGIAKCVEPNTLIMTPTGEKKIIDLKIDDKIMGIDSFGNIAVGEVREKFSKMNKLLEIQTPISQIRCSPYHKFLTSVGWIEAKDLNSSTELLFVKVKNYERHGNLDKGERNTTGYFMEKWSSNKGNQHANEFNTRYDFLQSNENGSGKKNKNAILDRTRNTNAERIFGERMHKKRNGRFAQYHTIKNNWKNGAIKTERGNIAEILLHKMAEKKCMEERAIINRLGLYGWFGRWRRLNNSIGSQSSKKSVSFEAASCDYKYLIRSNGVVTKIPNRASNQNHAKNESQKQSPISIYNSWSQPVPFIIGEDYSIYDNQERTSSDFNEICRGAQSGPQGLLLSARTDEIILENKEIELIRIPITKIKDTAQRTRTYDIATTLGNYIANGIIVHNSWTAVTIAKTIDKTFDQSWQVIQEPHELFDAFAKVRHLGKKYKVIVIDEGSVLANSKAHYTFLNRTIVSSLQIFRNLKCMVIICMPSFFGIDKGIRTLVTHAGYPEKETNEKRKVDVFLKLRKISTDEFGDKIYRKNITMRHSETGRKITFKRFFVQKLDKETAEKYEESAEDFKNNLRAEWQSFVRTLDKNSLTGGQNRIKAIMQKLKQNQEHLDEIKTKRGYISTSLLRDSYGVTQKEADVIKATLEREELAE